MVPESILATATLALATLTMIPGMFGQEIQFGATRDGATASEGIRTDRLTPRQLETWKSIQRIVQAVDRSGRPLHPRLFSLWRRVQSSGHTIFVEMMERQAPTRIAGTTTLQRGNFDGNHKVIVIWLHLWAMDNAFVDPAVRRSDGLIPFYRLGRYERYAEVLGHELAHAVLMLEDPEYARLSLEYGSAAAEMLRVRKQGGNAADDGALQQRLQRLQSLADKIEKPAEAAELEIWRELRSGQRRGRVPVPDQKLAERLCSWFCRAPTDLHRLATRSTRLLGGNLPINANGHIVGKLNKWVTVQKRHSGKL
jgi:hypothetical protein